MKHLCIGLLISLISACAPIPWHRQDNLAGPEERAQFNVDNAQCRLMARGAATGFVAAGDPNFVAGAAIGNTLGNAVRGRETYKDCMNIKGYVEGTTSSPAIEPAACDGGYSSGIVTGGKDEECQRCVASGCNDCSRQCI